MLDMSGGGTGPLAAARESSAAVRIRAVDLKGKVALLTGVKRIGGVVAEWLAREGCDVALVYNRSAAEADATAARVKEGGRRAITLQANLADPAASQNVVDETLRQLGRIDVFVAMAGLYTGTPFEQLSLEIGTSTSTSSCDRRS